MRTSYLRVRGSSVVMRNSMKKRVIRVVLISAALGIIGTAYYIFYRFTGKGIPCVFNLIFKKNCPGCGITRAVTGLLKGNYAAALAYNYMAPLICIFIADVYVDNAVHYVKNGKTGVCRANHYIGIVFLVILIVWGIVRNILGI